MAHKKFDNGNSNLSRQGTTHWCAIKIWNSKFNS